jgi:hypothetical protein
VSPTAFLGAQLPSIQGFSTMVEKLKICVIRASPHRNKK